MYVNLVVNFLFISFERVEQGIRLINWLLFRNETFLSDKSRRS